MQEIICSLKERIKYNSKRLVNAQIIDYDEEDDGLFIFSNLEYPNLVYFAKREILNKFWKAENCFGNGKHVVFSASVDNALKPEYTGKFKPLRE